MMDCRKTQAMLSAYHDRELPDADRGQVGAHLRACPDCTALLESMARIDAAAEVPEPGPEYWRSFDRRLEERIGREKTRPETAVVPPPTRGWMRRQLRYLVPAAAAAAMVVAVVRHIGLDPGSPVPASRSPAAEADRVPASPPVPPPVIARDARQGSAGRASADQAKRKIALPPAAPATDTALDERKRTAASGTEPGRPAVGKIVPDTIYRNQAAPGAPAPPGASRETPAAEATAGAASARENAAPEARERVTAMKKSELAEKPKEDPARRAEASPCESARALATQGRFKDAEAAQRACLAEDASAPAQESGLVLLAELLDRQHRYAEADSVIEEAQARFPRSRSLELYQQQRVQVQSGRIPFPAGR
jgi:anti-sigma factor RsiW